MISCDCTVRQRRPLSSSAYSLAILRRARNSAASIVDSGLPSCSAICLYVSPPNSRRLTITRCSSGSSSMAPSRRPTLCLPSSALSTPPAAAALATMSSSATSRWRMSRRKRSRATLRAIVASRGRRDRSAGRAATARGTRSSMCPGRCPGPLPRRRTRDGVHEALVALVQRSESLLVALADQARKLCVGRPPECTCPGEVNRSRQARPFFRGGRKPAAGGSIGFTPRLHHGPGRAGKRCCGILATFGPVKPCRNRSSRCGSVRRRTRKGDRAARADAAPADLIYLRQGCCTRHHQRGEWK